MSKLIKQFSYPLRVVKKRNGKLEWRDDEPKRGPTVEQLHEALRVLLHWAESAWMATPYEIRKEWNTAPIDNARKILTYSR